MSGTSEVPTWWEVKSLGYNRQVLGGRTNKGVAGVSTFNLSDLNAQDSLSEQDRMVLGEDAPDNSLKVKAHQFYSKEIFIDRVFAGANPSGIPGRMQWVFHSFYKADMPKFERKSSGGRSFVMSNSEFAQCGFDGSPSATCSAIYGSDTPLFKLRKKLAGAIRNPKTSPVPDIILRTFDLPLQTEQDAKDYTDDFDAIKDSVINAENARSWIIQHARLPGLNCEEE